MNSAYIFYKVGSMETQERAFLQNYRKYNALKRTHVVLPRIAGKLDYLAQAILNQEEDTELRGTLDSDEADALDTLDHHVKMKLFVSISDCLLGRDSPTQAVQAFIRYGKLSTWKTCYTSHDSEHLYLTTDKKTSYKLAAVKVVRGPHRKSERFVMSLEIEKGTVVQLAFLKEAHSTKLFNLFNVKEQNTVLNKPTLAAPSFSETSAFGNFTRLKNIRHRKEREEYVEELHTKAQFDENKTVEAPCSISSRNEELPDQHTNLEKQIMEDFSLGSIIDDFGFKLLEVTRNGRILVSETEPTVCRLCMNLESSNKHSILKALSAMPSWNAEFEESKVVNRVQPNSYIYYERIRSQGFTSRKRDFVFLRQGIKIHQRIFLLDKSVEHTNYPSLTRIARGIIKRRVTALVPHHNNTKLTLMVVQMDVDYSGYSNPMDSQNHTVRILQGYGALNQYLDQQMIRKQPDLLYNFEEAPRTEPSFEPRKLGVSFELPKETAEVYNSPPIKRKQEVLCSMANSSKVVRQEEDDQQRSIIKSMVVVDKVEISEPQMQQYQNSAPPGKKLSELMMKSEAELPTEDYLELITKHKQHETLCLRHAGGLQELVVATPLHNNTPGTDNFIFQHGDWVLNKSNEFIFVNQAVMDAQKDVIKWVIRKIGTNIVSGKSVMNMSLPVEIFDKRGLLERSASSFGYAPVFLEQASQTADEMEQMKLVVTFMLSINSLELKLEKPFNPILGETFQGYLGTTPIHYEQISHHPPISAYYMKNNSYELYGNLVSFAELGLNSGTGGNAGVMHIKFPINNSHFECSLPGSEISGLVFGERKMRMVGKGFVLNRQRRMITELNFGKDKKGIYESAMKMATSDIAGGIFTITEDFVKRYSKASQKYRFDGLNLKDIVQKHCELSGIFNQEVIFDGKTYKKMLEPCPYQLQYERVPLPSNSNFRQDIIYLRMGNLAMSQQAKEHLEDRQRADKKLRSVK